MKEETIYQQALAKAIEQTANGQMAVTEYIKRLALMKAQHAFDGCIGKTYNSSRLKTEVMAVAVGYRIKDSVWKKNRYDDNQEDVVTVNIAFAADVTPLLESKRKQLTDAERKHLKEIQRKRKHAKEAIENDYRWYRHVDPAAYKEVSDAQQELYYRLKNKLNVIDIASWSWSLTDILRDDFLQKGMNYNYQTICESK